MLCAATQHPEMTVASQNLLKTEFLKAVQMLREALPIVKYDPIERFPHLGSTTLTHQSQTTARQKGPPHLKPSGGNGCQFHVFTKQLEP
jgi:hypothetical protein